MAINYMFIFSLLLIGCVSLSLFVSTLGDIHEPNTYGLVSILVIGDWGRKGHFFSGKRKEHYNQSVIADQMGVIGKKLDIDFVILTGDNNYGLPGVGKEKKGFPDAFRESFTDIYTAESLQKRWYTVLRNCDDRLQELNKIDWRWNCRRYFFHVKTGLADFLFIDTTPFVDGYFYKPRKSGYLRELLRIYFKESRAPWKIVGGYHAINELNKLVLRILKENNVDMYINGHDRCLQNINSKKGIEYLTSGRGSKVWDGRGRKNDQAHKDDLKFYCDGQGFMSAQYGHLNASIAFYDAFGKIRRILNLYK